MNRLVRRSAHQKTVSAPGVLRATATFLVDSLLFTMEYLGGTKYAVSVQNSVATTFQAYITDNSLLGLDVMSQLIPASAKATVTVIGIEPGDELILSYRNAP